MSCSSQRPSDPAYYIEDSRIFRDSSPQDLYIVILTFLLFVLASVSHYSPVRGAPMSTENGSGEGGLISEGILILSHPQNICQITILNFSNYI